MGQGIEGTGMTKYPPPPAPPPEFFSDLPIPGPPPPVVSRKSVGHGAGTAATGPLAALAAAEAHAASGPVDYAEEHYAEAGSRFVASTLDSMLIGALYSVVLAGLKADPILTIPVMLLYRIGIPPMIGTTPGCRAVGIRLVTIEGRTPTVGQVIVRALTQLVSTAALGIGYFAIFSPGRRQAWHDRASGIYVVDEEASPIGPATDPKPIPYSFSNALAAAGAALLIMPHVLVRQFAPEPPAAIATTDRSDREDRVDDDAEPDRAQFADAEPVQPKPPRKAPVKLAKSEEGAAGAAAAPAGTGAAPAAAAETPKESSLERLRRELLRNPNEELNEKRDDVVRTFTEFVDAATGCKIVDCYRGVVDQHASPGRRKREAKVSDFTRENELRLLNMVHGKVKPEEIQTSFMRDDNQDLGVVTVVVQPAATTGKAPPPAVEVVTYFAREGEQWRLETGPFERPARKR